MRLLENLYVIDGPCFGKLCYVYAIEYSGGLAIIDAGVAGVSEETTSQWLNYWGLDSRKITHVFLTHGHWDHVGLAARWRSEGALVAAQKKDSAVIEKGGPDPDNPFDHQAFPPCRIDMVLEGDCRITVGELEFDVIAVPGHSPGSCIYRLNLDGKDLWFTGDFLCPDGIPEHGEKIWWTGDVRYSAADHIASCKKVWKQHPGAVLGGHGYLRMGGAGYILRENYKNVLKMTQSRG
ncbi:MAG: MBL fold metallo-hydrolase [Treponema sp.]|jgi:glyoxylase-like metal-dependent hydrolase (beta-lactamase superfamily II)|nr:MBL fold metallo-hydrolase [Treponema sp.]